MTTTDGVNANAETVLKARYFLPDENLETFWDRISLGRSDYREIVSSLKFLPNSPTLFNVGTSMGTLSACFKFDVPDSMEGIMDVARKAALVQKWGGGVGYVFSELRPKGAAVKTTHRMAGGPVRFMKMYHAIAEAVTQGGKRDGAQMGILHCEHRDLLEFIKCKDNDPQGLSTFNISVALTDEFMRRAINSPMTSEAEILSMMAESAWKTGDPGCYFIDSAEASNPTPWLGKLTGTNPCGEVPLLDNEPCNLGSINLAKFVNVDTHEIKWQELKQTVNLAIQYLDDVLDLNQFPDKAILDAALTTRKLGLGVMGWADMLALLEVPYDTSYAVELGGAVMAFINDTAMKESWNLAQIKGNAPCFAGHEVKDEAFRNATRTCIAPTGTISIIAGASSGIEPHFAREWTRYMGDGTALIESISVIETLHERGSKFVPKTAMEIGWQWHIKHQAAFQQHTDLAVSKTINMPQSATVDDIRKAYVMMYQLGCKGGTIYRDGSRSSQVLNVNVDKDESQGAKIGDNLAKYLLNFSDRPPAPMEGVQSGRVGREALPNDRKGVIHKFTVGEQEGYLSVGHYDDGRPGEIFITTAKVGSTVRGLYETIGILTSLALQHGVPLDRLTKVFEGITFEPNGMTRNKEMPTATSVVDYIFHWMRHTYMPETMVKNGGNGSAYHEDEIVPFDGVMCPDCGSKVLHSEGCLICSNFTCGWSRC